MEGIRGGLSVAELCRKYGISDTTYYKWNKEFIEAGKIRLEGDILCEATSFEIQELHFTKGEAIRYISHLDYADMIQRAICRAKLPAAYSEGFNPHLKIAFASALAVRVTSEAEYMDFDLTEACRSILHFFQTQTV